MTPLFGAGSSPVTSVAPGADGSGGLAAFAGREGERNLDFFQSPGEASSAIRRTAWSTLMGAQQRRTAYFGSATYDLFPWLQGRIRRDLCQHRGQSRLSTYWSEMPISLKEPIRQFNPFGQDVNVSLK